MCPGITTHFLIGPAGRTEWAAEECKLLIDMQKEIWYVSPSVEVYEALAEGVLCSSSGNEGVGEEEGAGGFN